MADHSASGPTPTAADQPPKGIWAAASNGGARNWASPWRSWRSGRRWPRATSRTWSSTAPRPRKPARCSGWPGRCGPPTELGGGNARPAAGRRPRRPVTPADRTGRGGLPAPAVDARRGRDRGVHGRGPGRRSRELQRRGRRRRLRTQPGTVSLQGLGREVAFRGRPRGRRAQPGLERRGARTRRAGHRPRGRTPSGGTRVQRALGRRRAGRLGSASPSPALTGRRIDTW